MNNLVDNCIKLGFSMMRLLRIEDTNDIDLKHTKRMVDAFIETSTCIQYGQCEGPVRNTLLSFVC